MSTETIRPTGAGDRTELTPTSGANYTCVDEASENSSDFVRNSQGTAYKYDDYALGNPVDISESDAINKITVYFKCAASGASNKAKAAISVGGVQYLGNENSLSNNPNTWVLFSYDWDTNPATEAAWTLSDINALKAGVGLKSAALQDAKCDWIYVVIDYSHTALFEMTTDPSASVGGASGIEKAVHRILSSVSSAISSASGVIHLPFQMMGERSTCISGASATIKLFHLGELLGEASTVVGGVAPIIMRAIHHSSGSSPAESGVAGTLRAVHRTLTNAVSVIGGAWGAINRQRLMASASSVFGRAMAAWVGKSSYDPVDWDSLKFLSTVNFDTLETIYQRGCEEVDAHYHALLHYGKEDADVSFDYAGATPFLDADKIDDTERSAITTQDFPLGIALAYDGGSADFSDGYLISDPRWHICDGGTYHGYITTTDSGIGYCFIMKVLV